MGQSFSYVMVTPYSIAKSRTGGVIARLLSQANLELVAAQIIAPDENFTNEYAASLRRQNSKNNNSGGELLAGYVENNLKPSGGRRHRCLFLLFRGENPCRKLSDICGALFQENRSIESMRGETIRDTYSDLIIDPDDSQKVIYFEPAVLTPRRQELADENMALFSKYFGSDKNLVRNMAYPDPSKVEETLVIIKPDNWNYASGRPGTIIDMFSRTGLRITGIKVFSFSLNQALDFYGPVEASLKEKLAPVFGQKAKEILERELAVSFDPAVNKILTETAGMEYAREQFRQIVDFMSGTRPDKCPAGEENNPGKIKCMALVYEGENAVKKIRDVLGPTDPLKAPGGTVRREFGRNVMVNTAHASDSTESYKREAAIVKIDENSLFRIIDEYLAEKTV